MGVAGRAHRLFVGGQALRVAIQVGDLVMTIAKRVAMLALGLITIASTAPAFTQTNGDRMTAGRAAAIRECNRAAAKYPNATYGATFEINVYRACMTQHGQQE
jgi:hypothetical protein